MPQAVGSRTGRRPARRGGARPPTLLIGVRSYAGVGLLEQLLADRSYAHLVCLDVERPGFELGRAGFYKVDLTMPTADALVAEIIEKESIRQVVHAAFQSGPGYDDDRVHELETIGTLHVLNACAAAGVERIVVPLTTLSYGARADNPNYLDEQHPLRGDLEYPFVRDKIEAEQLLEEHARRHGECCVTVLRAAPVIGPDSRYFYSKYFRRPLLLSVAGFDPLMQFLHQDDLSFALKAALERGRPGAFNLAGAGVLPYSAVIALLGRVRLRLLLHQAWALCAALWPVHLFPFGPRHLDYLRYMCVADCGRAQQELDFRPHYSSREAVLQLA